MLAILRSWLATFPQWTGRMPAVHWKRLRTRLEPIAVVGWKCFRSWLEESPQLVGNYFALFSVQSMACRAL